MRIYLAGKIYKGNWRNDIVRSQQCRAGGRFDEQPDPFDGWRVEEGAIFGKHDYSGPFFTSCDHGCAHGPNTHGNGDQECVVPPLGICVDRRKAIAALCAMAIKNSDLFFAWLDDGTDAYGTLAEIGFAVASGIPTIVATAAVVKDVWFAITMAHGTMVRSTPEAALRDLLSGVEAIQPRCDADAAGIIRWLGGLDEATKALAEIDRAEAEAEWARLEREEEEARLLDEIEAN